MRIDNEKMAEGFDDFTPSWYLVEGSSILLSMYLRAFLVIYQIGFQFWWPRIFQSWDQKFTGDPSITRCKTHAEYITVYKNAVFNISLSFAEILNIIFMTFSFAFLLPHIFVPNLIFLILFYYKDKAICKNF
jgi:hypothetical protein